MISLFSDRKAALPAAFFVGFSSLVYEIYCLKVLFLFFTETIYAASLAISAFLAGLAFSALLFSSRSGGNQASVKTLRWMLVLLAVYALTILRQYQAVPVLFDAIARFSGEGWLGSVAKYGFIWIYLFVPAFLIGGAFPTLNGLYLSDGESGTRDTGRVYFFDTLGAIVGAFITGFFLIPRLGFESTLLVAAAANVLTLFFLGSSRLILTATSFFLLMTSMDVSAASSSLIPYDARFGTILFQKNSPFGVVTVGQGVLGDPSKKGLFINYRVMCCNKSRESDQAVGAWAVMNCKPGAKVLNIGLGCGNSAAAIAANPNVKEVHVIEINPVVAQACREHFSSDNSRVLSLAKTTLFIDDGAHFIRTSREKYDAIVVDIEEASVIHSSPLFTLEYFQFYRDHLKPGGIFSLWSTGDGYPFAKVLLNTVKHVFSYVDMRVFIRDCYVYYASEQPLPAFPGIASDAKEIQAILDEPTDELNTLSNRTLERLVHVEKIFSLPGDSHERYVRSAGVAR